MWQNVKRSVWGERRRAAHAALARQDHSTRATAALQKLVETDPAFGSLSLWCKHRDAIPQEVTLFVADARGQARAVRLNYDLAPAYTDGESVYYGKAFETFSLQEQVAVCAHELMHVACRHVSRGVTLSKRIGPGYDPALFNIATDALINETLTRAGHALPQGTVVLGKLLVEVLDRPAREAGDVLKSVDAETLYRLLADAVGKDAKAARALGSLAGRVAADLDARVCTGPDMITDAAWSARLNRALDTGARAGRGIGVHAYRIADLPRVDTPWEVILRRLLTKAVTQLREPSYARPSRRWLALDAERRGRAGPQPAFEPGHHMQKGQPRIVVCIDVSGSVSSDMVRRFTAEVVGIGKRRACELHLVVFDHGIQLSTRLDGFDLRGEIEALSFKGGGGTSFAEPIAEASTKDPSVIVVLTDMLGPFGPDPKVPVIWATPNLRAPAPPFGRKVILKD